MKFKSMNIDPWKTFFHFKSGFIGIAFALNIVNFIILFYNYTNVNEYMSQLEFGILFVSVLAGPMTLLGGYSWRRGENRKSIDESVKNNPWIGDHAKSWELYLNGDIEGSKKIMAKYKDCGESK